MTGDKPGCEIDYTYSKGVKAAGFIYVAINGERGVQAGKSFTHTWETSIVDATHIKGALQSPIVKGDERINKCTSWSQKQKHLNIKEKIHQSPKVCHVTCWKRQRLILFSFDSFPSQA